MGAPSTYSHPDSPSRGPRKPQSVSISTPVPLKPASLTPPLPPPAARTPLCQPPAVCRACWPPRGTGALSAVLLQGLGVERAPGGKP